MRILRRRPQELQESQAAGDRIHKDIRIMLIDDQEIVRYELRRMLEQEEDMEVVNTVPMRRKPWLGKEEATCLQLNQPKDSGAILPERLRNPVSQYQDFPSLLPDYQVYNSTWRYLHPHAIEKHTRCRDIGLVLADISPSPPHNSLLDRGDFPISNNTTRCFPTPLQHSHT